MATGICAISNVLLNFGMRIVDVRTRWFWNRDILCNIDPCLSHYFAHCLILGKILNVLTRYTSICMPATERKAAKAIGTAGYILFFFTTVPMCGFAICRLRNNGLALTSSSRSIPKYERSLLIHATVLTGTHLLKAILQYLIPNTLSSFAEPVLLLLTSSLVRVELFPRFYGNRLRTHSTHLTTSANLPASTL
ncbi:hypothetical protein PRIPAC_95658 [Pristionchus pacificus]|uniref:G protein-coupled receptor n=1 Tax=Pristionchus pacificus TaxID=54126 RepID=A0A2A6D194_PRIPA|nr:hypothetical protein PRIPAC_95658 [Pristionchus pacificus]|eukprot:PDM84159.1 G protein-coupled receptor [Pristionchus pacificus]